MGYRAYNILTDYEFNRQRLEDEYRDDSEDADSMELERRERERYASEDVRLPLLSKEGA